MANQLEWLGHGGWKLTTSGHTVLLDPFVDDSPVAVCKAADLEADFILVSHGHFDHIADVAKIAKRTNAQVIANFEIAGWLQANHGVESTIGMNLGGWVTLPFGKVQMTVAHHSSQLPDGSYGGNPGGFVLALPETTIYFACDTALFSDMQLIGETGIDVAVLPIGDLLTMGPEDSVRATKLINPKTVLPAHYNTWPPIAQDAHRWATMISEQTSARPVILQPGESFSLA